ncbi:nuclease-related domain-containing protein [Huintestinicola sp.]|uniref:nuclease-related domain-containing protein n=1 Tax=Huintestinicola sp. TaxID=2981661 RepID=UPI003D7E1B3C
MQLTNIFSTLDEQYRQFKCGLKGDMGEFAVNLLLKYSAAGKLKTIRNIYVPLNDGKTSEIDIVVVHNTGLYAVECKNYSGWIFGSADNRYWTQTFANGKKYQFYNPVLQNKYHIKALSRYLAVNESCIKSYIVFGTECTLKKVPENTDDLCISALEMFITNINHDIETKPPVFSDENVAVITEKLSALRDSSGKTKAEHKQQVRDDHPEKRSSGSTAGKYGSSFTSSFFKF